MTDHAIGTREEWLAAREEVLKREKEHTRLGDEIAQQRRDLPWVRVEKNYRFQTDDGEKSLVELFDGRSQRPHVPAVRRFRIDRRGADLHPCPRCGTG